MDVNNNQEAELQENKTENKGIKKYDLGKEGDLFNFLFDKREKLKEGDTTCIKDEIVNYLKQKIKSSKLNQSYKIIFLIEDNVISKNNLDQIYAELTRDFHEEEKRNILMVLNSPGGYVGPAYLISKCCKEYSKEFSVGIPRQAKSSATLISLGAKNIHMGSISELGPIDIQINRTSSLSLGEAVKYVASIVEEYPKSADMFSQFLIRQLPLEKLGETKRVAESIIDYAERLLSGIKDKNEAKEISEKLVNGYKDHGFVIDKDEALQILGDVVKFNTEEYKFSDEIYKFIESVKLILWIITKDIFEVSWSGRVEDLWLNKKETNE